MHKPPYNIPENDLLEYARLPTQARSDVITALRLLQEMSEEKGATLSARAYHIARRYNFARGCSWSALRAKHYRFAKLGWRGLVDRRRLPLRRHTGPRAKSAFARVALTLGRSSS
jgi:hypothetical protein